MKKILILTTMVLLAAGTVYGSEMIVQLKSGNTLVVRYTGNIESVTLQGDSDSIIGMEMHVAEQQQDVQQKTTVSREENSVPVATTTAGAVVRGEKSSSSARIKWARPIDDENLKNARSPSREVTLLK